MPRAVRKFSLSVYLRLLKLAAAGMACFAVLAGWIAGCKGIFDFRPAYGPPSPGSNPYRITGTVRSAQTGADIPDIQVTIQYGIAQGIQYAESDSLGRFRFEMSLKPWEIEWTLRATDIDGVANGEYHPIKYIHAVQDSSGQGGSYEYQVNVFMEEKKITSGKSAHENL